MPPDRKKKKMFIFFQACERAESSKSCHLIGSKSGRYFTILPAKGPVFNYVAGGGGVQVVYYVET